MIVVVENSVVVLKGVALLVFEEDTWNMALCEWIVVAIASQLATVESLKVLLITINLVEECETAHALVAYLTILHRIIVANHVDI